jgi:FG-GAP-like repeat
VDKAVVGHRGLVAQLFSSRALACLAAAALLTLVLAASSRAATFETTAPLVNGSPVYVNARPAAADINHDGYVDLVGADADEPRIDVLLGHGDGSFDAPLYFPSATYQGAPVLGDLDGDGNLDVVVPSGDYNGTAHHAVVLLGDGKGGFGPAVGYPTTLGTVAAVIADLDGDGHLDVATANYRGTDPYPGGDISVLRGNGDGALADAVTYHVHQNVGSLVAADLNGDGAPDLAAAYGDGAAVLLNQGKGTFADPVLTSIGGTPESIAAGRFDERGPLDLVLPRRESDSDVLLRGPGDGTFPTQTETSVTDGAGSLAAFDFDGDGHLDLVSIRGDHWFLRGHGDGTFADPEPMHGGGGWLHAIVVADIDNDGQPDFVARDLNFSMLVIGHNTLRPTVETEPATLAFSTKPGSTAAGVVHVVNRGPGRFLPTSLGLGGAAADDFSITANHCAGGTLLVGQSCAIDVSFGRAKAGESTAALRLDARGVPEISIPLKGTAADTPVPLPGKPPAVCRVRKLVGLWISTARRVMRRARCGHLVVHWRTKRRRGVRVRSQSPAAGRYIDPAAVITIRVR